MGLLDVLARSCLLTVLFASCGAPHRAPAPTPGPATSTGTTGTPAATPTGPGAPRPDPDLNRPPPKKLLAIDWDAVRFTTEADALALWAKIAPTGADWEEKLDEVPASAARPLARAMLRSGNFTCMKPMPPNDCAPLVLDVDEPGHAAGLGDPCLRRLLALWSIGQLEASDIPSVMDAFRGIAAIPPPESQLVAAALRSIPDHDHADLLELIVIAAHAGQRDLLESAVSGLEVPQLIEAATKHHLDAALTVLSAEGHRAVYLGALADDALATATRTQAITDLLAVAPDDPMPPDLRAALVKAAGSRDCLVAATAARALEQHAGDRRFVPTRPRAKTPEAMLRALCVLASYEPLAKADEPALLATYVPPKGLERILVEYDSLSETDPDGDGDPHTRRSIDLLPRAGLALPEVEDLARAMKHCTGTTCTSVDREFRFGFKPINGELWLSRLEVVERPPCRRP